MAANRTNLRMRPGYPAADCRQRWARHRLWSRLAIGMFLGWIPYGFCIFEILSSLRLEQTPLMFVPVAAYALAWVVICNLAGTMRCPRCGFRFFAFGPFGLGVNQFARKCRNCGLKKWHCPGLTAQDDVTPGDAVRPSR